MKSLNLSEITVDSITDEIKTLASHLEQLSIVELVVAVEVMDAELEKLFGQIEVVIELTENKKKTFKELISSSQY